MIRPKSNRRRLSFQSLECRRVLVASLGWDGPGQGAVELTYHISGSPPTLSQEETNEAIRTALDAWSSVADITFVQTDQPGLRDSIDISFTNIDGTSETLAQAYFPDDVNPARIAGDIQFDISESWEVGNSLGQRAFDLVWVAVHEIGHALGIDHSNEAGSVLTPSVTANQAFAGLSHADISAIQELYASSGSAIPTDNPSSASSPIDDSPVMAHTPGGVDSGDKDPGNSDDDPFPLHRWRRGGDWHAFGGRMDVERTRYNYSNPLDANRDDFVSALDALMIINQLNRVSEGEADEQDSKGLCDTNGDGSVTPRDALLVINAMDNAQETSHQERHTHRLLFRLDTTALFTKFDANGDENLDADELPECLSKLLDFAGVDVDGNALISTVELEAAVQQARKEKFDAKDENGDGFLVESEVGERFWSRVSLADSDADSQVTFDEFDAWVPTRGTDGARHGFERELRSQAVDAAFGTFGRKAFGRGRHH